MSIDARYVHMVVCDDVRLEIGNKLSLMGTYDSAMFVGEFPILLSKLAFVVTVSTPRETPFKSLRIEVRAGDKVIAQDDVNSEELVPPDATHDKDGNRFRTSMRKFVTMLSPMIFDGPTLLRAHAFTEDGELLSNGLVVTLADPI